MTWFSAGVTGIWELRPETELLRRVSYLLSYSSMLLVWRVRKKEGWEKVHTAEEVAGYKLADSFKGWNGTINNYAGTTAIDQESPRQTENIVTLVVRSKAKNAMLINHPLITLEVEDSGKIWTGNSWIIPYNTLKKWSPHFYVHIHSLS